MTYQHGLPFNQRVERKDKVKPGSQRPNSDNYHHSGARRGPAGGTPGTEGEDDWLRPGLNTLTRCPSTV